MAAASMISLPVMEPSSSARGQSADKKRHKVALDTKIFKSAIKAVQVQTTSSSSLQDSHRKSDKPSTVSGGDDSGRATESKSESDVVLSRGSSRTGRSQSANQMEMVEIPCSSESKHSQENTEKGFCGPIITPLFKNEDDWDLDDSHLDTDRSLKCKDFSKRPAFVRCVRSANPEPSIERGQMLNRREVERQNRDCRSSDRGRKEQRGRDRRSSDSGRAEQQNKDCQSSNRGRGKTKQNYKGNRSSDHAKKEQQTKDYRSSYPEKVEQRRKDYRSDREKREQPSKESRSSEHEKREQQSKESRSSEHDKIEQPSKESRSSEHEKIEQPSKESRSSEHEKIEQPSKVSRSSELEKIEQPCKESRSSDREEIEEQSKDSRSSDREKMEQPSKDSLSSDREKIEQPNKVSRSSELEKIEQPCKECRSSDREEIEEQSKDSRSSDREKIEQPSTDSLSSDREKIEQPSTDSRLSDREQIEQPSKEFRSSKHEKLEQPSKDSRSSDREKIEQPSKDSRSSDREQIEQPSKDSRSSHHRKLEPQNRDCQSYHGETVDVDGGKNTSLRYPGSYRGREEQQRHDFGDHRGRGQRGRGKRRKEHGHLYHYSKVLSDSSRRSSASSQNADYQHNVAEKPRKLSKERLVKNSSMHRNDEAFVASSDEWKDHSKTRTQFGGSVRGRKSRRGAGALGLDYNRHMGSRESMRNERLSEAEMENSTAGRRGRGNSSRNTSFSDGRCSPEHRPPKKTQECKTDKTSDYYRGDFPNKCNKERANTAEQSEEQGFLVYNRGYRGRALRGRGPSTRSVEQLTIQNRRVICYDNDSRRNSTSFDETRRDVQSQRSKACGRVVGDAPGKSITASAAPEKSAGVSIHSSKQNSCDDRTKDKDCIYNSRNRSKDDEKSRSHYGRPVTAGGGAEKLSTRVDGTHCYSDRTEVSKRNDAVVNSDGSSSVLSSRFNMLHVSPMEFTNTLLRDGVSSCANSGDDVDSVCSVFSALDTSSIAASVSSAAMDAHLQRQIPEAQGTSVKIIPLHRVGTDALVTPVHGYFQPQEVQHLNSQGLVRNLQPLYHPQLEGSLEKPFDSQQHGLFIPYPDGHMQIPYGMSSSSCSSLPSWNNQLALPPAGPQFRTPVNSSCLQQPVRPFMSLRAAYLPPPSNPQASKGYGSGRFLHTPPVIAYQPPEPTSPAPDPRALLQAAFQGVNNQMENPHQAIPLRFSSPFQAPLPQTGMPLESSEQQTSAAAAECVRLSCSEWKSLDQEASATPSTTPTADNWSLATTPRDSDGGYGDKPPPSQQDNGPVMTPQDVPQFIPALNISRKEYQHWMECYVKARDTNDENATGWCRHYWYVAVYLPSVRPRADAVNSPAVGGSDPQKSLDMGASSDLSQTAVPLESSEQQISAESPGYSDRKSCDSAKNECCQNDTPHRTFSGMSVKSWKGSRGAEERMRMKCKRLSYGDLDAADVAIEAEVSPAKAVKKFKVERTVEKECIRSSNKVSFSMNPQRFRRSWENQSFQTQFKAKSTEGRGEESDHSKFQVIRRSSGSMLSEAITSPENCTVSEWMDWKAQFLQLTESATVSYIDSHCHLDLLYRRAGFQGTFKEFRNLQAETFPANFFGCVAIFCNPLTWSSYLLEDSLFNSLLSEENIWAAVGCHPKSATDFTPRTEMNLRQLLKHDRVKALGEVGLDYSGNYAQYRDVQIDVLQRQVLTAVKLNKPLVIHARDAEHEIGEVLEKLLPKNYKIHRHCFLGSWNEAEAWLEKFPCSYIGLTPAVTHSKPYSALRDLMWNLPLDRLLLETDAPYFIPAQIPLSEMSLSHPGLAITVAIEVAKVKHLPYNDVLSACLRNTREMYDL